MVRSCTHIETKLKSFLNFLNSARFGFNLNHLGDDTIVAVVTLYLIAQLYY